MFSMSNWVIDIVFVVSFVGNSVAGIAVCIVAEPYKVVIPQLFPPFGTN